jgi:succinoglycan biosynthesis transport protein ExoP
MTGSASYVAISRRALDLEDYIDIARRHAGWIAGPTFFGIVISIVVAFLLPNTYISTAEMQITPAQISTAIVASTLNQQLAERIQQMENEILSRTSLSSMIQDPRLDLYKSDRASKPLEDVIEQMRTRDIKISILSSPGSGVDRKASAFMISFSYSDPHKAQAVVQTMITKFQESNLTTQRDQQNIVTNFVRDGMTEAKANLDRLSEELTQFRVDNAGKLPESTAMNMAQLSALQSRYGAIADAINRAAQERVQLDTRLDTLRSQLTLIDAFDRDTETGPAPVQARRQNERLLMLNKQIADTETHLAQMKQIYTPNYPDIHDAELSLEVIRKERDALQKKQDEEEAALAARPRDPVKHATSLAQAQRANDLQGQINQVQASIETLRMQHEQFLKDQQSVNAMMSTYQEKLAATSGIEAKYADLIRDQKAATEKYTTLQEKQSLTQQNADLLQRKAGENLDVLDPPSLPEQPAKPNRYAWVGGGAAISLVIGFAMAGVQEAKDTSLKNLKDVRAYTNLPVLCSVPLLENTMLVRRKRRIGYLAWSAAVILGLLAVGAALYYHYTVAV